MQTVFLLKCHDVVESKCLHLLAPYLHHAFTDISTHKAGGVQHLGCKNGEIAGAGGNVEQRLWVIGRQGLNGLAPPPFIDVQ